MLFGRTRTIRHRHNEESGIMALLLNGIFLLLFKTKHEDFPPCLRFVLQRLSTDWDLYGVLLIQVINRS